MEIQFQDWVENPGRGEICMQEELQVLFVDPRIVFHDLDFPVVVALFNISILLIPYRVFLFMFSPL